MPERGGFTARLFMQDLTYQTAVFCACLPVFQDQITFVFCQDQGRVTVLSVRHGVRRTYLAEHECGGTKGIHDQLIQRNLIELGKFDKQSEIRIPFSGLIVGVSLTGNIQILTDVFLCQCVCFSIFI